MQRPHNSSKISADARKMPGRKALCRPPNGAAPAALPDELRQRSVLTLNYVRWLKIGWNTSRESDGPTISAAASRPAAIQSWLNLVAQSILQMRTKTLQSRQDLNRGLV